MGGCFDTKTKASKEKSNPRDARVASTIGAPANSAVDDVLMDLGLKKTNDVYDRDLAARSARSKAAVDQMMGNNDKDNDSVVTKEEEDEEKEEVVDGESILGKKVDNSLTKAEDISKETFTLDGDTDGDGVTTEIEQIKSDDSFTGLVDQAALDAAAALEDEDAKAKAIEDAKAAAAVKAAAASVGTAAGAAVQQAAAQTTSVGPAEDKAIAAMTKGRRSTILTTPSGLLGSGEEEGKTRRRRSLIGS
tara:strand:+ start:1047 stop:1790 length:744 start_codon:yes stop_codon:yes gene_type:complete